MAALAEVGLTHIPGKAQQAVEETLLPCLASPPLRPQLLGLELATRTL